MAGEQAMPDLDGSSDASGCLHRCRLAYLTALFALPPSKKGAGRGVSAWNASSGTGDGSILGSGAQDVITKP